MKHTKVKAVLFCLIIGWIIAMPQRVNAAENTTVNISVQYGQTEARTILGMINDMRTSSTDAWYWNEDNTAKVKCSNLSTLTYDYDLERIAMKRAAEIALSFDHTRPNNEACFSCFKEENVNDCTAMGENIASGQTTAKSANTAWREDDEDYSGQGHRRNMLSDQYNCVGIAHVYYNGIDFWVEEFACRSQINAKATEANDIVESVPVSVSVSNITGVDVGLDKDTYSIRVGEKVPVKVTSAMIIVNGNRRPVDDSPSISIEDSSVASYSDGKITGIAEGSTTLKTTLYGMTATSAPTVSVHDCDNHWDEGKITTEPTCTEKGERTLTCNICQNTKTEEVAPTGHKYAEDWTIDIAPTCETMGTKSHHCKACDHKTDIESIPALGHSWKDNGDGTAICSREGCGKVHTHQWGNSRVEKEATCVEAGTRIFSCIYDENCEAVKTEKIDPLGHDYKVSKMEPATCEKSGEIYSVCNRCEAEKIEEDTSAPALGHIWEDKSDGTAICTREGCTKTHIHVWDEGTLEIAPTCKEKGKRVLHCTYDENCQATTEKEEKELGHDYQLSITEAPTCEAAGKLHYKCSRCESTKVEEDKSNPALNHKNTEVRNNVEATCHTEGYTGDVYCKDCKIKLSSGTVIPLIAHEWDKGKITKKATYTSKGEIVYTCKLCEDKKKVSIPKLTYPKTGTVYTISGNQYKVTKVGTEVSLIHTKKNAKSISIPATITAQGITYKVVTVASKAFNNNTKLSKVTIGKNIVKINNKAFFKCKNLKTVNIQTILLTKKTASKKAFVGINKKLVIKVPKKVKKAYMVVFKGVKVK